MGAEERAVLEETAPLDDVVIDWPEAGDPGADSPCAEPGLAKILSRT